MRCRRGLGPGGGPQRSALDRPWGPAVPARRYRPSDPAVLRGRVARQRAYGCGGQFVLAERAVLDVAAGDGPILDVLARDGDRRVGSAAERGEQRQVGDGGGVAAREPLDDGSHWIDLLGLVLACWVGEAEARA